VLFNEEAVCSRQIAGHHRCRSGEKQTEPGESLQAIETSRAHWACTIQIPAPHKVNARLRPFSDHWRASVRAMGCLNADRSSAF
jgi:hypothetical protein